MCGIGGVVGSRLGGGELRDALGRMAESMHHRGPDQGATRVLPAFDGGLAVRRLALLDVEGGGQPLENEDRSVVVLLNGEIYNHRALRCELEAAGHRFRTGSDGEVVAHLYEDLGDALLGRLDGMFAVAVFDLARRRLLLARDGPGMKPLYYVRRGSGVAFASEVKALIAGGFVTARPDPRALDVYLSAGFVPAPMTVFAGVEKLAAGTFAVVDGSGLTIDRFWSFGYRHDEPERSDEEHVDELEARLTAAVGTHLQGDVPVGAYLSGGWDSSLVSTLAARCSNRPLKTFSIVFPDDPDVDESRHSRLMADRLGSEHQEIEYRPAMFPDLLPRLLRQLEEPMAAVPAAPAFVLASLAGANVKAVIGGEGADELFGGYRWYRSPLPYWLRRVTPRPVARLGARWIPEARARRWMRICAAPDLIAADSEWRRFLTRQDKRELLFPELRSDGPDLAALRIPPELAATCRGSLERRLAHDIRGRLADAILITLDKTAMAHSLEVRAPFLDRGVVDLAARLPARLKMHRGREKVVVRKLAERLLPPEIARRRKQGLAYPRASWFEPPAYQRLREMLLDSADGGPFRRRPLERLLDRRPANAGENPPLAVLAILQTWWNEFL